jgi:hypothetical protein
MSHRRYKIHNTGCRVKSINLLSWTEGNRVQLCCHSCNYYIFLCGPTVHIAPRQAHFLGFEMTQNYIHIHTHTHLHIWQNSSKWVISSSQMPLLTQHATKNKIWTYMSYARLFFFYRNRGSNRQVVSDRRLLPYSRRTSNAERLWLYTLETSRSPLLPSAVACWVRVYCADVYQRCLKL